PINALHLHLSSEPELISPTSFNRPYFRLLPHRVTRSIGRAQCSLLVLRHTPKSALDGSSSQISRIPPAGCSSGNPNSSYELLLGRRVVFQLNKFVKALFRLNQFGECQLSQFKLSIFYQLLSFFFYLLQYYLLAVWRLQYYSVVLLTFRCFEACHTDKELVVKSIAKHDQISKKSYASVVRSGGSDYNKGGLDSRFKFTSFRPIKENPNLKEEWSLPKRETSLVLLRLHAKHIAVCRCVCRSWLSLTTSRGFISAQLDHARSESDPQFLFHDSVPSLEREKAPVKPTQSGLVCFSPDTLIIGSINGLICSTGNWRYCSWPSPNDVWIWNPSTGLSKKLPMGIRFFQRFSNIQATFAFCWDEESDVYKVVRIISKKCEPTFAEVWSSDINSWEEIDLTYHPSFYHPSNPVNLVPTTVCNVFVRNSPHWAVLDYDGNPFIISFDVKTNKLKLFSFPSQLSSDPEDVAMRITTGSGQLFVTNWMGELAVLDYLYMAAEDEETLAPLLSEAQSMYCPYRLWKMEVNGRWICSRLVSFGFDFHYCLNSVGGGKYMLLQTPSDIALYDIMLLEEDKFFADEMERDPKESPLPAPFWEHQHHFNP
ncbi:F-box and associated interaction domains-containing protein, partial [Striga asiatica]